MLVRLFCARNSAKKEEAMKTIFIFDSFGEDDIRFFVLEGDYTHLDKTFLNQANGIEENQDELNGILAYDVTTGKPKVEMLTNFPLPVTSEDAVIVVGFLP
jgi:hypothetical protein